jgi:hypothetical protein
VNSFNGVNSTMRTYIETTACIILFSAIAPSATGNPKTRLPLLPTLVKPSFDPSASWGFIYQRYNRICFEVSSDVHVLTQLLPSVQKRRRYINVVWQYNVMNKPIAFRILVIDWIFDNHMLYIIQIVSTSSSIDCQVLCITLGHESTRGDNNNELMASSTPCDRPTAALIIPSALI